MGWLNKKLGKADVLLGETEVKLTRRAGNVELTSIAE